MSKKLAIAVSALALGISSVAMAESENLMAGRIGFEVGNSHMSDNDTDRSQNVMVLEGSGAVNIPMGDSFSLQMDMEMGSNDRYYTSDGPLGRQMYTLHASARNSESGLIGAFGGVGRGISGDEDQANLAKFGSFGGLEAQKYMGNLTLYAQAYYSDFRVDSGEPEQVRGVIGEVAARYFLEAGTMVELVAGYGESERYIDGDDRAEMKLMGAKVKHPMSEKNPVYLTAQWRKMQVNPTSEGDNSDDNAVMIGVEFVFGAESLKQNDRSGATLRTPVVAPMAASWLEKLD